MKPWLHAKKSAKKFGGAPEDYMAIHNWFDQTKACHPDMRHRAMLHNAFGCFLAEQMFGDSNGNLVNSQGQLVSVRDVAEQHVLDDMGFIPTVSNYLNGMPFYDWLGGRPKKSARGKTEEWTI